jgi:hypothetical protein
LLQILIILNAKPNLTINLQIDSAAVSKALIYIICVQIKVTLRMYMNIIIMLIFVRNEINRKVMLAVRVNKVLCKKNA